MEENKPKRDYLLPASIFISALLISGSLIYNIGKKSASDEGVGDLAAKLALAPSVLNIRAVDKNDHILGNPNAPVKIVEFSDLECPFCKRFHPTLKEVMAAYGDKVAWVYRHFPLDSLHSKARKEAEATECAAELGGNDKFWAYIDRLFEVTPSNDGLDLNLLATIASDVGLDRARFQSCLDSGKHAERVSRDLEDATNAGGRGTPFSVVVGYDGKKYPVSGALPFEQVKSIVEQALK